MVDKSTNKVWEGYKNYDHYFTMDRKVDFFDELGDYDIALAPGRNCTYLNIPASFDIETTSTKDSDNNKYACMYIWQLGINGSVITGRTWQEFIDLTEELVNYFSLSIKGTRLMIYVHNLGYEFQFMRKYFNWENVFSVKERRPVYALTKSGIEFRCSLLLSNYALAYVGANLLIKYPVKKMVGDLDYSLPRHSNTELTSKEMEYCLNDVRVVMSYIQEKIEQDGNIGAIPLTNTGYVRRYCRNYCLTGGCTSEYEKKKRKFEYRAIMNNLQIHSEREYEDLKAAFSGGFTHANAFHANELMQNVGSADLTSSYPFAMIGQLFPMSKGEWIGDVNSLSQLEFYTKNFCCLFTARFTNLRSEFLWESYISVSHCRELSEVFIANNGRLSEADVAAVTITELDWDIINRIYSWDDLEITGMRIYEKGYLPRPLIMSILELYKNKTSLKGVEDKEIEYMVSKNMINSAYGMAVTSIVRDEQVYGDDDNWYKEEADVTSQLVDYNKSFNRFLFYAWGVWVTAHARHNLWEAIFEFDEDYIYADTDSIKGQCFDKHLDFFKRYNHDVMSQLALMCNYHNIPFDMVQPLTKKGERKMIGLWDIEEPYEYFKTLGAKRYMYVHKSGEINMTVSGVNKKYAMPYMLYTYGGAKYHTDEWLELFKLAYSPDPNKLTESKEAMAKVINEYKNGDLDYELVFFNFRQNLKIPEGYTGKQSMTYIDDEKWFTLVDYNGMPLLCHEKSAIHMEPASYFFSITEGYMKYLAGCKEVYL